MRRSIRVGALVCCLLGILPSAARAAPKCGAADFGCAATGTCVIAGTHDVGDGCHLDFGGQDVEVQGTLRAGRVGGAYSITAGQLRLAGGKIKSTGDTIDPGGDISVACSGRFWMTGAGSRVDTGGGAGGGSVTITAAEVLIEGSGAIVTDGGAGLSCGDAGDVTIVATSGAITLGGSGTTISAATPGYDCGGGSIFVDGPSVTVQQGIDGSGGSPQGISLRAEAGDLVVASAALVDVRGRGVDGEFGNDGGSIEVSAPSGALDLQGPLNADGSGVDGGGGDVTLVARGDVTIGADVSLAGLGTFASGGTIEVATQADLSVEGSVVAAGGAQGDGGLVDMVAGARLSLAAGHTMSVRGGLFGGGFVDLHAFGDAEIGGDIDARGSSGGDGGAVDVRACRVTLSSTIDVEPGTGGQAGSADLTGGRITLGPTARLEAQPCHSASCNTLTLKSTAPTIDPGAFVDPAASIVLVPSLAPCCGNGVVDDGISSPLDVGEQCEDGNRSHCDGCTPSCRLEPSPPCGPDGNDCTRDCSPTSGCTYAKLTGTTCADEPGGNVCTTDVCQAGVCTHVPQSCSDGIGCTVDACDPVSGCYVSERDAYCDDGEPCTTDVCDPAGGDPVTGCRTLPVADGTSCDDGSICTTGDRCSSGACVPQGPSLPCDDGDDCTLDVCDAVLGCVNQENPTACDCLDGDGAPLELGTPCADGNDCTVSDTCDAAGSCVSGASCPDDGDPCTRQACVFGLCAFADDQCPKGAGCVEGEPCSDGDACTTGICEGGACVTTPKPCSDGDECTGIESCFPAFGCRQVSHAPVESTACDGYVTDAFTCYRAHRAGGTAAFVPAEGISVEDGFWSGDVDAIRPTTVCLPASVAGGDPEAVGHGDWILGYRVSPAEGAPAFVRRSNLEVVNAFGTIWLDAKRPDCAFVPTSGDAASEPAAPVPPDPDSFTCYRVGSSEGAPRFRPVRGLAVEDAFGSLGIDVKRPIRLCKPANVQGANPEALSHPTHLLCYRVRESASGPSFSPVEGVFTKNLLAAGRLDVSRVSELCLPSTVTVVGPEP